jgi:hypothetical protein
MRHVARSRTEPSETGNGGVDPASSGSPFQPAVAQKGPGSSSTSVVSRLMACIIEGFAAAGFAEHPYFTDQADWNSCGNCEPIAHAMRQSALITQDNPWIQEASMGSLTPRACSPIARFLSERRRRRAIARGTH